MKRHSPGAGFTKLLCAILLACSVSQASAITISGFYTNTFVTNQDPTGIGAMLFAHLRLELPSFPATGLNGTFTFGDGLIWAAILNSGGASDFFASSSQLPIPNPIDPSSYFTFTNNVVTSWSLIGNASVYGTAHLESISGVHDYILEPNGAYAINSDFVGAWSLTGIPVPGPAVGAGIPGLLAALGGMWMLTRRRRA